MRTPILCALFLVGCLCLIGSAQHGRIPSLSHAERQPNPADNTPSTLHPPSQRLDLSRMRSEAEELASLAQTIPAALDEVGKGTLPKDLGEKLKRIEKLSRSLRNDVSR
jgi:hypothetical protein